MSNAARNRGGTDIDDLVEIDDTRNGLLLNVQIHRPLGTGESAFLKVGYSFPSRSIMWYLSI
jgi:hypothetical protein